jgi:hypothetical protein
MNLWSLSSHEYFIQIVNIFLANSDIWTGTHKRIPLTTHEIYNETNLEAA